jgi:hypothetical protein
MVLVAPALAEERMGRGGRDVKLVPYHRFEITSPLKREEALAAVSSRLEERKWFRVRWPSSDNDERFDGSVTQNSFNITRIMGYRNSFAPVVDGEVHDAGRFSRIVITMKPHVLVPALLPMLAIVLVAGLVSMGNIWPGLAMMALIYVMVLGGFWFEANKLEQTLRKIFQAM